MSVNNKRPQKCKIDGCRYYTCGPHTELCRVHWDQQWAERRRELMEEDTQPVIAVAAERNENAPTA